MIGCICGGVVELLVIVVLGILSVFGIKLRRSKKKRHECKGADVERERRQAS